MIIFVTQALAQGKGSMTLAATGEFAMRKPWEGKKSLFTLSDDDDDSCVVV